MVSSLDFILSAERGLWKILSRGSICSVLTLRFLWRVNYAEARAGRERLMRKLLQIVKAKEDGGLEWDNGSEDGVM